MQQDEPVRDLTLDDYRPYVTDNCDIAIGYIGGVDVPFAIIPVSERAISTFQQWGMDPDMLGIQPPADAMDFVKLVPGNWITEMVHLLEYHNHHIEEITLPQHRVVVH